MDTIGIITYDYYHLKTEQVVTKLVNMGYNLVIFALPFHYRKNRVVVFNHRPNQFAGMHVRELALKYNMPFYYCENDQDIMSGCDTYIITGAGRLSKECITNKRIINCHPGIIPIERGLDAFKWGIYDFYPVGNTLYYISQELDLGEIIKIQRTPLYFEDTISDFAERHYSEEIDMLVKFQSHIKERKKSASSCSVSSGIEIVHKRMPAEIERLMLQQFPIYKERYAIKS